MTWGRGVPGCMQWAQRASLIHMHWADQFLPGKLGLGSQSTGIFLLQVWAFLRSCAPSLPWERCQTQVTPCQEAPKAFWEVWVCMVGVGGTHGNGVCWWETGHCKSSLLPRLCPPAPAHLPPTAQRPGPGHSCCLTWKRNSREVPTHFCCYRLKHDLASGKSSQRCVTIRFFMCNYQVRWDVICKYLFWIIFLCPTGLFSARQNGCSSSLGRASPRVPRCARRLCRHALLWMDWEGGNITVVLPGALTFFG